MSRPVVMLFRDDLRLADHEALTRAVGCAAPVVCVYVHDDRPPFARGGAQKWWLHHSLIAHARALESVGAPLNIRTGPVEKVVDSIIEETGADRVFWSRRYAPHHVQCDTQMKARLRRSGTCQATSAKGRLLMEPWEIGTASGDPYRVFTPFWNCLQRQLQITEPLPVPSDIPGIKLNNSQTIDDLKLLPTRPDWSQKFHDLWQPGEDGATEKLDIFVQRTANYATARDYPSQSATSLLSPHLQMGEVSPRQVMTRLMEQQERGKISHDDFMKFYSELAWRDFNSHLLFHMPELTDQEFKQEFRNFPWRDDPDGFACWTQGQTGYPLVDAGMRELYQTGTMHNRVRMVTASFLTKHLLIDWRMGMNWFWDTLLDADIASNSMNWQWVAGCGADAAPYFRIFNPTIQAQKFDPDGIYIRKWVPEIAAMPTQKLANPSAAQAGILGDAGITLGTTYPRPIVDHKPARERALEAYANRPRRRC